MDLSTFLELWRNQDEVMKMARQQYRAWSDCMYVQASLALYWWLRLFQQVVHLFLLQFIFHISKEQVQITFVTQTYSII